MLHNITMILHAAHIVTLYTALKSMITFGNKYRVIQLRRFTEDRIRAKSWRQKVNVI